MDLNDIKNKSWYPYTVAACSAVLLSYLLKHLDVIALFASFVWKLVSPLLAGAVIAYMFDPVARFFEKKEFLQGRKKGRTIAVAMACVLIFGVLFVLFLIMIPAVIGSITSLISNIDTYEDTILAILARFGFDSDKLSSNMEPVISKLKELLPSLTANALESSGEMSKGLANVGVGCILGIYFLLYKEGLLLRIRGFLRHVLKSESYAAFSSFLAKCDTILLKYISCSLLDAVFVGCSNALFMLILGISDAALISLLVGITNLAPTFGPLVGGAIGFIIIFLSNPSDAVWFLIFTLIIQTIDGYVVKPRLYGNTFGVSSLWILISIILGGKVFGVVGVLLAIPFAAIVQYLFDEGIFLKGREEEKKEEEHSVREDTYEKAENDD